MYGHANCVVEVAYQSHWDYWLLGLNFFEQYYAVFDQKNKKIGFAESIHNDVENFELRAPTVLLMEGMEPVAKVNPDQIWRQIYFYALLLTTAIATLVLGTLLQNKLSKK